MIGSASPSRRDDRLGLDNLLTVEQFDADRDFLNDGDQTVEEVTVSVELLDGEEVVDEAETVIATLGEAETITAMLVVADDPTDLTIEAGVVTYQIAED